MDRRFWLAAGPIVPAWDRHDRTRRRTMIMDEPARMEDDPRGGERRLFAAIPYVQPGT